MLSQPRLRMELDISYVVKAEVAGWQLLADPPEVAFATEDLLPRNQGKLIEGGVQYLEGMREAEMVRIQVGLSGGFIYPPMHNIVRQK